MKSFRYLIVKYNPLLDRPAINIGVIVQSDEEISCKFNQSIERVKNIVGDVNIEEVVFTNLEKTFKEKFAEGTTTITNKETGEQKTINYTNPEYLDYLSTNILNNYVFNNRGMIEAENIEDAINRLYNDHIGNN